MAIFFHINKLVFQEPWNVRNKESLVRALVHCEIKQWASVIAIVVSTMQMLKIPETQMEFSNCVYAYVHANANSNADSECHGKQ